MLAMRLAFIRAVCGAACLAVLALDGTASGQVDAGAVTSGSEAWAALEKVHADAVRAYRAHEPAKAVRLLEPVLAPSAINSIDPGGQHPAVTAILNDYGFFLAEAGLPERAAAVLQAVVARAPDRAVAYLNLADAEHAQGQTQAAREHYRRYADLMGEAGKTDKIPARVGERTGFTYGATFVVTNASDAFDVTIRVARCDKEFCEGAVSYAFRPKQSSRVVQVISAPDTAFSLSAGGAPLVNEAELYGRQSAINVGDFNFDGVEDVALCTGRDGSYHAQSYDVYLQSKAAKKFVHSSALSALGKHLGMFEVDRDQKQLTILDKDGCCWHVTRTYDVVNNRPRMVFERIEDGRSGDEVKVTERTLVRGKWKTVRK